MSSTRSVLSSLLRTSNVILKNQRPTVFMNRSLFTLTKNSTSIVRNANNVVKVDIYIGRL